LAERLNVETRLPALPGEVSKAFVAVWQQAIHLAQGIEIMVIWRLFRPCESLPPTGGVSCVL
jgi:hypothetical protein